MRGKILWLGSNCCLTNQSKRGSFSSANWGWLSNGLGLATTCANAELISLLNPQNLMNSQASFGCGQPVGRQFGSLSANDTPNIEGLLFGAGKPPAFIFGTKAESPKA